MKVRSLATIQLLTMPRNFDAHGLRIKHLIYPFESLRICFFLRVKSTSSFKGCITDGIRTMIDNQLAPAILHVVGESANAVGN